MFEKVKPWEPGSFLGDVESDVDTVATSYGITEPEPTKVIPETLSKVGSRTVRILGTDGKPIVYEGLNKVWANAINKKLKKLKIGLDGLTLELQDEILNDLIRKGQFKKKKLKPIVKLKKPIVIDDEAKPVTGSELVSMPPELILNPQFFNLFVESKAAEQFKFDLIFEKSCCKKSLKFSVIIFVAIESFSLI